MRGNEHHTGPWRRTYESRKRERNLFNFDLIVEQSVARRSGPPTFPPIVAGHALFMGTRIRLELSYFDACWGLGDKHEN